MRTRTLTRLTVTLVIAGLASVAASRTRACRRAHNDGYRLGLDHAARGLLDPPPTTERYARGHNSERTTE